MISLLDNTVLSNFTVVQRPDLLRAAFGEDLATPQQAYSELQAGIQTGKLVNVDWQWLPIWTLQETELIVRSFFRQFPRFEAEIGQPCSQRLQSRFEDL